MRGYSEIALWPPGTYRWKIWIFLEQCSGQSCFLFQSGKANGVEWSHRLIRRALGRHREEHMTGCREAGKLGFGPYLNHGIKKTAKERWRFIDPHVVNYSICLQFLLFTLWMLGPGWLTFCVVFVVFWKGTGIGSWWRSFEVSIALALMLVDERGASRYDLSMNQECILAVSQGD